MRRIIIALFLLFALGSVNTAWSADRRIALVVGNGAYSKVAGLANPAASATAMEAFLRQSGFDVTVGIDLTREQFGRQLGEFGARARGADLALFYYAGHGLAVDGVQLLVPVDVEIAAAKDPMLGGAINLDHVIDVMGEAKVKLLLLDASRDNPFKAAAVAKPTARIAPTPGAGQNMLLGLATGPGQPASDGAAGAVRPYTRALIDQIGAPGVEIVKAMSKVRDQLYQDSNKKQMSWGMGNISGDVFLNPAQK